MKEYFITPEEFAVNASFVLDKIEEILNGPDYGRFKKFRNRITETKAFNNYGYTMLSGEETSYGSYYQYIKF